jgi:superfamily II DNA or RNA helicase
MVQIELRDYQEDIIVRSRAALARHKSALIVLPTGGGKTAIASFITKRSTEKGKWVMFGCHRDFLVEQTSDTFSSIGVEHTIIAPQYKYHPNVLASIASIDTLKNRWERIKAPDIFIVDEAIHAAAKGWSKVIEGFKNQGTMVIGLAACPQRGDGIGLGRWFGEIVEGPDMAWLIEHGYLSPYKLYEPQPFNRKALSVRGGEFINAQAEEAMNKPSITGCAVNEYTKIAAGKQAVMFCNSIKHAQDVAQAFCYAGFSAASISSNTDKTLRKMLIKDFRDKKLNILTSVDIFSEGFDLPAVEYAGLIRPTKSLNIYRQQIGRALRVAEGKTFAHIADHASNHKEHDIPCAKIEWTLADKEIGERRKAAEQEVFVRTCPKCYYTSRPSAICPNCGHVYPIQSREVKHVDGELIEVNIANIKKTLRQEVGKCQTIDDLKAIQIARGYKPAWVYKMAKAKKIET